VSETKEPKIAGKGILIALGMMCIVLVACLGGVVAAYTLMINDKNNAISSLDYQISQLNSSVAKLQNEVADLQKQLDPNTTYTVIGTLSYANVSAIIVGIIVANISPSFYPNLAGSFMYLTFSGQLTSTLPINAWTFGSMVAINGTISFDNHSQTYFLNWINGSLYSDTVEGVNEQVGLEVTMALSKTTYSLGESISITLTITNISNQTITYDYADPNSYFRVYNDTNDDKYDFLETQFWPQFVEFVTLNAGESLTDHYVWQQMCNATVFSQGVPVSPGTCCIVGYSRPYYRLQTTPILIIIA